MSLQDKLNNIEKFNIAVGLVFALCFECFPIRKNLYYSEIGDELDKLIGEYEEGYINQGSESNKLVAESVKWLSQAGYLYGFNERTDTQKSTITLSPKALEVLNAEIDSLKEQKTKVSIGDSLVENIKTHSKDLLIYTVKEALKNGVKMAMGS